MNFYNVVYSFTGLNGFRFNEIFMAVDKVEAVNACKHDHMPRPIYIIKVEEV